MGHGIYLFREIFAIACARDCHAWADIHDAQVNIDAEKPRANTIRRLKEMGKK